MFSVVIPVYNCQDTIEDALNSVISQTRKDLIEEIIIINDGSTDKTEEIVKGYIMRNREIYIRYIFQENAGVSVARNKGIRLANAEWIALLDSDDKWKCNKIERQYEILKDNPQILFLGTVYPLKILFKTKSGLCKLNANQLCIRSMPQTPTVVFKRETAIELGLFNEQMRYGEDINFYQKFLLKDSYYILAEDLVDISIQKNFFAQSGLSSHLYQMHLGRNQSTRDLQKMNLISKPYMWIMLVGNWIKFFRRLAIKQIQKSRYKKNKCM